MKYLFSIRVSFRRRLVFPPACSCTIDDAGGQPYLMLTPAYSKLHSSASFLLSLNRVGKHSDVQIVRPSRCRDTQTMSINLYYRFLVCRSNHFDLIGSENATCKCSHDASFLIAGVCLRYHQKLTQRSCAQGSREQCEGSEFSLRVWGSEGCSCCLATVCKADRAAVSASSV